MDKYTAQEQAFKRGYEKGYEAGIAEKKKAYCDGLLDGRRAALECVPLAKWIPVTERLPEKEGRYLCVVRIGHKSGAVYVQIMNGDKYGFSLEHIYNDDVTHWMHLPEP